MRRPLRPMWPGPLLRYENIAENRIAAEVPSCFWILVVTSRNTPRKIFNDLARECPPQRSLSQLHLPRNFRAVSARPVL